MNVLAELRRRFATALAEFTPDPAPFVAMVKPSQDTRFGDFQANCAMPLSKQVGQNPRDLAAQIIARLDVADLCQPPEVAGPGFINLRLRNDWLEALVNRVAQRALAQLQQWAPGVAVGILLADYHGAVAGRYGAAAAARDA